MSHREPPILILGVPRSGTTWIGLILGRTAGARYVHEPDNETEYPFALRAKAGLGRFPALHPGERAPRYEACWAWAFAGGHRTRRGWRMRELVQRGSYAQMEAWCDPRRRSPLRLAVIGRIAGPGKPGPPGERAVVKSVHGLLAGEWIVGRWSPQLVVVRRHPLNVVSSWVAASNGDEWESALEYSGDVRVVLPPRALEEQGVPPLPPAQDRLATLAWLVGLLASARERLVASVDGAVCVDHDEVCRAPATELRDLAGRLALEWTDACDGELERRERPETDLFVPERIAAEQPERWRERLSAAEAARAEQVLSAFPGGPWFGSPPP